MADTNNKYNFLDYEGLSLFWNNVKKVIEDNELVTATALTNLDTRVVQLEDKGSNQGAASNQIISISYTDLKTLRDNDQLVPGQQYRITDYTCTCTTTQENARAVGHAFDIIVTADDASTINEVARAVKHDGDTYFAGCDLNAWKIWYCLDNDTTRFAWADSANGKGVIYRMIDEFNNDIPYDFKNIQFKHPNDITTYPYYYYTFASDNVEDNTDCSLNISSVCYSNTIKNTILKGENFNEITMMLNQIIFIGKVCVCNVFGYDCESNTFGACAYNTFGNDCTRNSFGGMCVSNTLGDSCYDNTFGNDCISNTLGGDCAGNALGDSCFGNTFGDECQYNTFGYDCAYNTFGDKCQYNTFGGNCYSNSFVNSCSYNTSGNGCQCNTFGNNCYQIKFAPDSSSTTKYNYYQNNHFGDGCQYILFKGTETASYESEVQNYNFAQGLKGTEAAYLTIDGVRNRVYETKVAKNSTGELKIYCDADLIQ